MNEHKKFKDQCDNCRKFDYLISINGKCVCSQCFNEIHSELINHENKQLSIYDCFDENTTKNEIKNKSKFFIKNNVEN